MIFIITTFLLPFVISLVSFFYLIEALFQKSIFFFCAFDAFIELLVIVVPFIDPFRFTPLHYEHDNPYCNGG